MSQRIAASAARAVGRRRALSTSSATLSAASSSHLLPSSPSSPPLSSPLSSPSPLVASLSTARGRHRFEKRASPHLPDHSLVSSSRLPPSSVRWHASQAHAASRAAIRSFGSSPPRLSKAKPKADLEPPPGFKFVGEEEGDDDDGPECPVWQNPLHHNNPDYQVPVFEEDYPQGEEMKISPLPPFEPEEEGKSVIAPPHVHALAEEIVKLNMLEVKELVDRIGEHFGFDDDDGGPLEGEGGGGDEAQEEEVAEERTAFDLKLTGFDAKGKIKVIKEVRGMTKLGLKEAKELVEGAPTVVMKGVKKEEAEELKAKLEAVGATIEIV